MYRARHRVAVRILYFAIENIAFQLTTYNYFLKEDYYV